jgi:cytoskeletal protein CcmA (bactofilin family)
MGTEPSVSKLRGGTNGNGAAFTDEEPVEATAVSVPSSTTAPAPIIQAAPLSPGGADLSILSRGDSASGRWIIAGDGEILGEFAGEIECGGSLLVGKGAEVTATILGNEVSIAGLVRGNITAIGRLRISATGRLEGDARVGALVVQEGGVHHGIIRVHPEGLPEVDEVITDSVAVVEPQSATQTPVDRVRKFWGEFF